MNLPSEQLETLFFFYSYQIKRKRKTAQKFSNEKLHEFDTGKSL
ncbi:hypothetical protein HMPREF0083_05902 [Aneurinibacillus aneurinilyticus ATCC 12856]|uniref:Uncharacterized protein n=1 Tax=Aneurinibacillus aneurinilyticus ATCC 12856 TaxID=649747 RepID=U1WRK2_ANEAE|nr:hypothetical protein HMPREF0083_05902 [Aneurinibacillus aneurinilyticus ATCC 12856]